MRSPPSSQKRSRRKRRTRNLREMKNSTGNGPFLDESLYYPNVFLAGWHDHDELPDIFAASDVVVLPSVREQFGLVLVEGMACGLPAIAVAAHGPGEIVTDGQTGWLVPPDDEGALAAALVPAVNDSPQRRRRGTAASAAVHTRYSWPRLGARLACAYEPLLARPPIT